MNSKSSIVSYTRRGFTLIELVMGIVVFAISLTLVVSVIAPQAANSVSPVLQARAAELAQSLMNEISAKAYDENSIGLGGGLRCGETGALACTTTLTDEEGDVRANFDDVDDYNGLQLGGDGEPAIVDVTTSLNSGTPLHNNIYDRFEVDITVSLSAANLKLITVTVTTPNDIDLTFARYRSNF